MIIKYRNVNYSSIQKLSTAEEDVKRLYKQLEEAKKIDNYYLEQSIKKDLKIVENIKRMQNKYNVMISMYFYQGTYGFIELSNGTKYVYNHREDELLKDSTWEIVS